MITGEIHPGSGLGDQLFTYITTRVVALEHNYDFGFVGKEFFKGKDFMQLDWGKETDLPYHIEYPAGKLVVDTEHQLWEAPKYYDPEVNFIDEGTMIDAPTAQDDKYWGHRLPEIRKWMKVEPLDMPDDLCVINFRGGEFATVPELFLTHNYWLDAIQQMDRKNSGIRFEVHTDDPKLAFKFFPTFDVIQNIALNWRSIRYAKHLILSNSAFGILPALLNENVKEVIAPRYHARRNIKQWSMPSNYYKKFTYI